MIEPDFLQELDRDQSCFEARFIPELDRLEKVADALRAAGRHTVLTSGSFDIIHEGHSMYLEAARGFGDFLIVGVDSDEKIHHRKGPGRPAVPQSERLRMITHQRGVGLVTLKELHHPRWELIARVRPEVLVATRETYTPAEIEQLRTQYGVRVEVLDRMATISTSARLRRLQFAYLEQHGEPPVDAELPQELPWSTGSPALT